jgi:hypothetical protein
MQAIAAYELGEIAKELLRQGNSALAEKCRKHVSQMHEWMAMTANC